MPYLKRKRSESELSFSGASLSSPPRPDSFAFSTMAVDANRSPFSRSRESTPSHLSSRTMKRFRNSRPTETEVHQHTLSILYSAQQQQQASSSTPVLREPVVPVVPAATSHQRSLESFWNLPSRPSAPSPAPSTTSSTSCISPHAFSISSTATPCEDCGRGLAGPNGDEDMMMVDTDILGMTNESDCCYSCGKAVCFSCSVSNLGVQRQCLMCAGRSI